MSDLRVGLRVGCWRRGSGSRQPIAMCRALILASPEASWSLSGFTVSRTPRLSAVSEGIPSAPPGQLGGLGLTWFYRWRRISASSSVWTSQQQLVLLTLVGVADSFWKGWVLTGSPVGLGVNQPPHGPSPTCLHGT